MKSMRGKITQHRRKNAKKKLSMLTLIRILFNDSIFFSSCLFNHLQWFSLLDVRMVIIMFLNHFDVSHFLVCFLPDKKKRKEKKKNAVVFVDWKCVECFQYSKFSSSCNYPFSKIHQSNFVSRRICFSSWFSLLSIFIKIGISHSNLVFPRNDILKQRSSRSC